MIPTDPWTYSHLQFGASRGNTVSSDSSNIPPVRPLQAPEAVRGAMVDGIESPSVPGTVVLADPTQMRYPWRSTVRTIFQALVALAALAPLVAAAVEEATGYDLDGVPFVVVVLAFAAAVARVMALPAVEMFLRRFVPFLAAASDPTK